MPPLQPSALHRALKSGCQSPWVGGTLQCLEFLSLVYGFLRPLGGALQLFRAPVPYFTAPVCCGRCVCAEKAYLIPIRRSGVCLIPDGSWCSIGPRSPSWVALLRP